VLEAHLVDTGMTLLVQCDSGISIIAQTASIQMPAPNPTYGPLVNLVGLNISDASPLPALNWYDENATSQVGWRDVITILWLLAQGTLYLLW
jgi:hypothetical protein